MSTHDQPILLTVFPFDLSNDMGALQYSTAQQYTYTCRMKYISSSIKANLEFGRVN